MKKLSIGLAVAAASMFSSLACADTDDVGLNGSSPEALKDLTINGQEVTPESVRRVKLEGPIYEVRLRNGDTFYSDAQGRYMVVGNLYDNSPDGLIDVTEQNNRQKRLDQLNALPAGETVDYPAQGEEIGQITVFTDTTCPYCKKLHQEIDQLTQAGVTVRYVPFPRAGSNSSSAHQLSRVMCSKKPEDAMTKAFAGQRLDITPVDSCDDAVHKGFQLGQRFGVQGTPSIVLPDGEMGEGYVPSQELIQAIKRSDV
ncbi:DsbC family protein [Kushneria indalinina]|uniref:Thiol:disulfide interchange protein n=1 Tax=Kushneria indalinina DSM 14324 TaxID=1122140 RepID=A0A3D9DSI3_9GAMM|nr:DsbC family protein [Kushneria indalinina]REC93369.1 thiol:disulfide interchange protein DsbC [Kushneria indalinina DSM 14324]